MALVDNYQYNKGELGGLSADEPAKKIIQSMLVNLKSNAKLSS